MTTIQFYHLLSTTPERAVPKLMEKALASGGRVVLRVGNDAALKQMSEALWANDPASFIPHGSAKEGHADAQPIYLTTSEENPNSADILCVLDGSTTDAQLAEFAKVLDVFDGGNETEVKSARERWTTYKNAGHKLQYIKQQPGGSWKIEAESA